MLTLPSAMLSRLYIFTMNYFSLKEMSNLFHGRDYAVENLKLSLDE